MKMQGSEGIGIERYSHEEVEKSTVYDALCSCYDVSGSGNVKGI